LPTDIISYRVDQAYVAGLMKENNIVSEEDAYTYNFTEVDDIIVR